MPTNEAQSHAESDKTNSHKLKLKESEVADFRPILDSIDICKTAGNEVFEQIESELCQSCEFDLRMSTGVTDDECSESKRSFVLTTNGQGSIYTLIHHQTHTPEACNKAKRITENENCKNASAREPEVHKEEDMGPNSDTGLMSEKSSEIMKDFWARKGNSDVQHLNADFGVFVQCISEKVKRCCTKQQFVQENPNEETVNRIWLCFSPTTGRVYCFCCKLFYNQPPGAGQSLLPLATKGFSDWKHAGRTLEMHKKPAASCNPTISLALGVKVVRRINTEICCQVEEQTKYWENILQRIVSVIKFIAEHGLAFCRDNEIVGSQRNGNYMGVLKLLAK